MQRLFISALSLFALAAMAASDADPARYRLTPAVLERMDAVTKELKDLPRGEASGDQRGRSDPSEDDDDDSDDAESIDDIARKLDAQPGVRAAMARHGLTSREYAVAALAALHAGMALAVEKAPGGKANTQLTPEQRANIEVMRGRNAKPR